MTFPNKGFDMIHELKTLGSLMSVLFVESAVFGRVLPSIEWLPRRFLGHVLFFQDCKHFFLSFLQRCVVRIITSEPLVGLVDLWIVMFTPIPTIRSFAFLLVPLLVGGFGCAILVFRNLWPSSMYEITARCNLLLQPLFHKGFQGFLLLRTSPSF